jgi:hypothetical protein
VLLAPGACRPRRVGNERQQAWVRGDGTADDGRVDLAREQHRDHLLARGGPLHGGWIAKLRNVRVLEGDPGHLVEIDGPLVAQDAAQPGDCGHRVRAGAHPPPHEIARGQAPALLVVDQVGVLEAAHHDGRQEDERLAVGPGEQERHDRQLRHVELEVPHDALEGGGDGRDLGEVEPDQG